MTIRSEIAALTGRFITGCLVTAALSVGGVWFVVDLSLRGVESAIQVTNERVTEINRRIERLEDKLDGVEKHILQGFKDMKQASITPKENFFPLASQVHVIRLPPTASSSDAELDTGSDGQTPVYASGNSNSSSGEESVQKLQRAKVLRELFEKYGPMERLTPTRETSCIGDTVLCRF